MARRGNSPGSRGEDNRGLQVEYAGVVQERIKSKRLTGILRPAGWYVWVRFRDGSKFRWEAVLALRFVRECDARRAAYALTAAGLDSAKRMKAAGAETVIRTAWEALAW